jgi:cell division protein FtsQ
MGIVLLLILGGSAHIWRSGLIQAVSAKAGHQAVTASVDAGLAVEEIFVVGRSHVSLERLRETLGIERGDAILVLDLDAARTRIEALSWVAAASIERRLPDTLYVRIVERKPFALWQHQGRMALVDDKGALLTNETLQRFVTLPLVVGEGAPRALPVLLSVLADEPEIAARVTAAAWVGRRRWTLNIDDRLKVKLPEHGVAAAWQRLVQLQRRDGILDRALVMLDLRHADRLIVRPAADAIIPAPGPESDV